ncbi:MAG: peptide-methionine (R)-S-oxide reductase [Ferruginibacter sp.]
MKLILLATVALISVSCTSAQTKKYAVQKTDAEWKKQLTAEQYQVARKAGTEQAYTGKYWDNHKPGYLQMCLLRPGII